MEAMDTSTSGLSRPGRPVGNAGPRLLSHALAPLGNQPIRTHMSQGVKRGFSPEQSRAEENKRRSLGGNRHAPSGPRAMRDEEMMEDADVRDSRQNGANGAGKSLIERLGGPPLNHQAPEFHMGAGSHRGRGQGRLRGGHHGQNGREFSRKMLQVYVLLTIAQQTRISVRCNSEACRTTGSSRQPSQVDPRHSRCRR